MKGTLKEGVPFFMPSKGGWPLIPCCFLSIAIRDDIIDEARERISNYTGMGTDQCSAR